uniref:Arrestin_C domain-containing protein n=1 Tax=Caenorhabditis tropicalis TaxID=1561998 RepID=A0A1I7T7V8_9PELO
MFANLVPVQSIAQPLMADIVFNNPNKQYFAGELVSGRVSFTITEPISARFIKISWDGVAKCDWNGIECDSEKEYLSSYIMAWISPDGKNELPAGIHKYRFSFRLPADAPPSFTGMYGNIDYKITVEVDRPWQWNVETVKHFNVVQKTCLAVSAPDFLLPAKFFNYKNSGLIFRDGVFSIKINFLKRAFLPGEVIKALVSMENNSSKPINQLEFQLIQQSHYHSRPQKTCCSLKDCLRECPISYKFRRDGEFVIKEGIHHCHVAPHQTKNVVLEIQVPQKMPATFESSMISMGYMLGFSLRNNSLTNNKLSCNARIVIGNEARIDEDGSVRGFKSLDSLPPPPPPPYCP